MGIDCSGFTQMVFKLCGMKLKRDAWQQAEQGETISNPDESNPGDLAFFHNSERKISHVGIVLPGNHIIHAHGKVRIDKIDKVGIYNQELSEYSHDLNRIKRIR
jgi:cell wall-associated NlpC family hydrolase